MEVTDHSTKLIRLLKSRDLDPNGKVNSTGFRDDHTGEMSVDTMTRVCTPKYSAERYNSNAPSGKEAHAAGIFNVGDAAHIDLRVKADPLTGNTEHALVDMAHLGNAQRKAKSGRLRDIAVKNGIVRDLFP